MTIIAHRINTISQLKKTDRRLGIEVDVRSFGDRLIIHHDPYLIGEDFQEWLKYFDHRTLILNVKEEGLEEKLIKLMKKKSISDYFFLDQSIPFLVKWSMNGHKKSAVRFSEYEDLKTTLAFKNQVDWVWVDCFNFFPLTYEISLTLSKSGFKICLVSPELQGRDKEVEIPILAKFLKENKIIYNAICTKDPKLWEIFIDDDK